MSDPIYYYEPDAEIDINGYFIGEGASALEASFSEFFVAGNLGTKSLKFLAKNNVTSQVVVETIDVVFNDSEVEIKGAIIDIAANQLITATIAAALGITGGWGIIAIGVASSYIYSRFLEETVDDFIDWHDGTVDVSIDLVSSSGERITGVLYSDGLPNYSPQMGFLNPEQYAIHQFVREVNLNLATGTSFVVREGENIGRYNIFSKEFIDKILDFSNQNILEFSSNSDRNNDTLSNLSLYYSADGTYGFTNEAKEGDLIIAKDTDRLFVEIDGEVYGFNPSHIGFDGGFGVPTEGDNLIVGTENDDIIAGASGNDFLYGGNGMDTIFGGSDNDTIYGGEGDDEIHGGLGDDTLYGRLGEDTYYYTGGFDTITDVAAQNIAKVAANDNKMYTPKTACRA